MEETLSCMEVMKVRVQAELLSGCLLWGIQMNCMCI